MPITTRTPVWLSYGVAIITVGAATALKLLFNTIIGAATPFLLYFSPVLVSAWIGGMGPGITATLLAAASAVFLFQPPYFSVQIGWYGAFRTVIFILEGLLITKLSTVLQSSASIARQQWELFQITLASIGDAVVAINAAGRVTFTNAVAERLIGYRQSEALGLPLSTVFRTVNQSARTPVDSTAMTVLRSGAPSVSQIALLISRNGQEIPVEERAAPIRDYGNTLIGAVLVFRDITEQQKTEQAILRSEERYRAFVSQSSEGIWRIEFDHPVAISWPESEQLDRAYEWGYIEECNDATAQMHGYSSADQLKNSRLGDVLARSQAFNDAHLRAFIQSGYRLANAEWRQEDSQGDAKYFLRNMLGIVENDHLVRIWGTQQDITHRKQVEEALSRKSTDLERSNSDLQQFAYVVSHDLQEPLRMISSYTQMLTKRYKGQLDSDADEFMGFIVAGAERMSQLIRDLLAYSRVVNIDEVSFPYIELEGPLYTALMNLRMAIQDSGAKITQDPLPGILGSRVQMVQLFQNLISNAIKYRGDAPPEIHIGVEPLDSFWRISVRDNGIGIDSKHTERVFGLFKRLHGTRYPGTGIGLALCKKIVEKHGGEIGVQSEEGHGATFFFTLPRALRNE